VYSGVGMSWAEPRCTVESVVKKSIDSSAANYTKAQILMKQPCMFNLINRPYGPVSNRELASSRYKNLKNNFQASPDYT